MSNHLVNETSPYLLQHANNPVDWYPWGEEAFEKAKREDKPVFLSVGYSTCHWCHVMAHESFEDEQIAKILNQDFISIKVDKEERPDVDSVYMSVCQILTGSGGWPMTIFMTPEQKPFMAGTYFPPSTRMGHVGFWELIQGVAQKWKANKAELIDVANQIEAVLCERLGADKEKEQGSGISAILQSQMLRGEANFRVINSAVQIYKKTFDKEYGGFSDAPKFPSAHNLLFLMRYYEKMQNDASDEHGGMDNGSDIMEMVDKTLLQMYRGGIFDHIGGGFSRYSTDRYFLVPHFEKMLYDNALLIMTYAKAYQLTSNVLYRGVAEKTAGYIMREMTSREGGFYSAQDADSEGVEGRYYVFEPIEIMKVLGRDLGKEFCGYFDITNEGNFEGKSIPNLLKNNHISARYNELLEALYKYRKRRYYLHLDDKILTSWNGLMIGAFCQLYEVTEDETYLTVAKKAQKFIEDHLYEEKSCEKDVTGTEKQLVEGEVTLCVSYRNGMRSGKGFLDDYANEIYALLALYEVTKEENYLLQAKKFCKIVIRDFWDEKDGGFFLSGNQNEKLFIRSKETYDGAMPSGNSMMAYNLVKLYCLAKDARDNTVDGGKHENDCEFSTDYEGWARKQLVFLEKEASRYPAGYAMALIALLDFCEATDKVQVVCTEEGCMVKYSS